MKILVTVLVSLALTFGILGCAPKEGEKVEPPPTGEEGAEKVPEPEAAPDETEKEAPAEEGEAEEEAPDEEKAE